MFSTDFNKALLNIIIKNKAFQEHIESIDPIIFEGDSFASNWFKSIKEKVKQYSFVNERILENEFTDAKELTNFYYADIEEYVSENLKKIIYLSKTEKYLEKIRKEISKDIRDVNHNTIRDYIDNISVSWVTDSNIKMTKCYENPASVILSQSYITGFPTGYIGIDSQLKGNGICRGDLGVVIAEANTGKTTLLCNFTYQAACYGKKVLFITFEMSDESINEKYYRIVVNMSRENLLDNLSDGLRIIDNFKKMTGGEIYFALMEPGITTVNDIEKYIDELKIKYKFIPDMVIIDYDNFIYQPGVFDRDELRHRKKYDILKSLALKKDIAIWTASQSIIRKRGEGEGIAREDITDSKGKFHAIDIAFGLNRDKKDKNKGNISILKNRNSGGVGYEEQVIFALEKSIISSDTTMN